MKTISLYYYKIALYTRSIIGQLCFAFYYCSNLPVVMIGARLSKKIHKKLVPYFRKYANISPYIFFKCLNLLGITFTITGKENIPNKPCLFVINHQSEWECIILASILRSPSFIITNRLIDTIMGHNAAKLFSWIVINNKHISSMRKLRDPNTYNILTKDKISLVIFPQATTVQYYEPVSFFKGLCLTLNNLDKDIPVIPIALNSGMFFDWGDFFLRSGKMQIKILPAINRNQSIEKQFKDLEKTISTESYKLLKPEYYYWQQDKNKLIQKLKENGINNQ